jgi:ferric hydroxamate/heme transport system substrate-binding protein
MKKILKKQMLIYSAILLCFASLMGCSSKQTDATVNDTAETVSEENNIAAETEQSGDTNTDENTITVQDVKGEVTIPANPQRVVDLSGNSDILHILGYSVIGTANSDAYDYTKLPSFLEDALSGAEILGFSYQDTMDIENILPLNPDLIIISTRQEKMYEQLKEIAPTIMIELAQTNWQDDLMTVAQLFNKTEDAQEWLNTYLKKAEKVGEEVKAANGADTSYLSFLASGGQLYVFDAAGTGSLLYEDMKLQRPEGMPEQEDVSLPVITYEGLASIDADYIIVIGTEEDMAALKENAIWNSLPAVAAGNVSELPSSPYFNQSYSAIGRDLLLDEIVSILEKSE